MPDRVQTNHPLPYASNIPAKYSLIAPYPSLRR